MQIPNHARPDSKSAAGHLAFTLIELVVVLATIAFLAATLLPGLASPKTNSLSWQCLNNNRQLCMAWRMYAGDNHDRIVYSSDDGTQSNPLNNYAWTQTHMDYSPANQGNWDINYDLVKRPLWPYSGKNPAIYKCPSDKSYIFANGTLRPRIRSMSMNFFLGGYAGTSGGWPFAQPYNIYTNLADIGGNSPSPGPAKTWVFLDMRPDSINWGNFITDMTGYSPTNPAAFNFMDLPGIYHNGATGFSFADGHCEMHKWLDVRTTPPPFNNGIVADSIPSPRNPDIAWLQDHSTRLK